MSLETNWIELNVSADGTATWLESGNVYQFSNLTAGVRIYTPFDPANVSALINIKLPDETVLQEKPMTFDRHEMVDNVNMHVWTYLFRDLATSVTGLDYAASLVISFRFLDTAPGKTSSKTTNQIQIPIQPSVKGAAMYVDPDTADELNAKIDENSGDIATLNETVGRIFDAATEAEDYAKHAAESAESSASYASAAKYGAQQASESASQAVLVSQQANVTANLANVSANEAKTTANTAKETADSTIEKSDNAVQQAQNADVKADNAVSASNQAKEVADEANTKSDSAVLTANEAKEIATYAKEGSGTAMQRPNGATDEFVPVVSLVGDTGQSEGAVMTQKAVTDALLETPSVTELSGEVMTIDGTSEGTLEDYKITGRSVQNVSPNLFDANGTNFLGRSDVNNFMPRFSNYARVGNNLFANNAGNNRCKLYFNSSVQTTYTISANSSFAILAIAESGSDGVCTREISGASNFPKTFTTSNIVLNILFRKTDNSDFADDDILALKNSIQLELGTTATPYQPYTGQPAPENPMPIESVQMPIEVVSRGKNIFPYLSDASVFTSNQLFSSVRIDGTFSIANGEITWQPSNGNGRIRLVLNGLKPTTQYTFSCKLDSFTGSLYRLFGVFFDFSDLNNGVFSYSFVTKSDGTYDLLSNGDSVFLYLLTTMPTSPVRIYDFMLNEGTTAAPYEPYHASTTTIQPQIRDSATGAIVEYTEPLRGLQDGAGNWSGDELDFTSNNLLKIDGKKILDGTDDIWRYEAWDSDGYCCFFCLGFGAYNHAIMTNDPGRCVKLQYTALANVQNSSTSVFAFSTASDPPYMALKLPSSYATSVSELRTWLAANPLEIIYKLAIPEIIPLATPLPKIPTLDGYTCITTTNTPTPGLYSMEYLGAQMGRAVTLHDKDGAINPVTRADLTYNLDTKQPVERDISLLNQKTQVHDNQIGGLFDNAVELATAVSVAVDMVTGKQDMIDGVSINGGENPNIEIGNRNGEVSTPFIDFHTDGKPATDFNSRIVASGNDLDVETPRGSFKVNGDALEDIYAKRSGNYQDLTAGNADKINNLQIVRDVNGVLKIGDMIIPQKKVLFSGDKALYTREWIDVYSGDDIDNYSAYEFIFTDISGIVCWKFIPGYNLSTGRYATTVSSSSAALELLCWEYYFRIFNTGSGKKIQVMGEYTVITSSSASQSGNSHLKLREILGIIE